MRTTIDLPDDLYRALKARAALSGTTMRQMLMRLIEQGLRQQTAQGPLSPRRREPPPVLVPPRGRPIPAVPRAQLLRIEEEEDEAENARPFGR